MLLFRIPCIGLCLVQRAAQCLYSFDLLMCIVVRRKEVCNVVVLSPHCLHLTLVCVCSVQLDIKHYVATIKHICTLLWIFLLIDSRVAFGTLATVNILLLLIVVSTSRCKIIINAVFQLSTLKPVLRFFWYCWYFSIKTFNFRILWLNQFVRLICNYSRQYFSAFWLSNDGNFIYITYLNNACCGFELTGTKKSQKVLLKVLILNQEGTKIDTEATIKAPNNQLKLSDSVGCLFTLLWIRQSVFLYVFLW